MSTATTIPDPDRTHAAGLTWYAPLESRPIVLGPSENHPELRPALALDAGRYWTHARHGFAVGRAEAAQDEAAKRFAFAPDLRHAQVERAALAQAATAWDHAIHAYAKELTR